MENIETRLANTDDMNFIYSTWLKSYRHSSNFAKKLSNEVFYEWHHKVIDRFLDRGGSITIAHPIGEPSVILGYLCAEKEPAAIIQYIYVKKPFRKMGIAKTLHKQCTLAGPYSFSHWTLDTDWIIKKLTDLIYNPYLL